MHCRTAIAAAALAAALTGCSSDTGSTAVAPGSPSTSAAPGIGTTVAFKRADTGAALGTITFREAVALPADCVSDLPTGRQALGLLVEIDNAGPAGALAALPAPTEFLITTLDSTGISQPTTRGTLQSACTGQFPAGAEPAAGRKTLGWVPLYTAPNSVALQYTPAVFDGTVTDWKPIQVSPAQATIKLPSPLPGPASAPAPTAAPTTTAAAGPVEELATRAPTTTKTAPVKTAPAAGAACDPDVDNWAKTSTGKQLKCAYAGGPTPKWVNSAPFIGTRQPGSRCSYDDGVAESPSGQTLVCTGERDSAVWTPGP